MAKVDMIERKIKGRSKRGDKKLDHKYESAKTKMV